MKRIVTIIAATLSLAATAFAADLKLGGGAPPIEKAIMPVKAKFQESTGIILDIKSYGPKFALEDLARGVIEGAVLFLKPEEVAGMIKKEGIHLDPATLKGAEVGSDRVKIIVNPKNGVTKLTKDQAKGIFSGAITNWKDVGGADTPVLVVFSPLIKGVNELFSKHVMGGVPFTKEVMETGSAQEVRGAVATNPEAVGLSAIGMVNATVKPLDEPEISVPVIIYSKGEPSANLKKLIDYLQKKQ
ncbi:MAG: phosphate ABC transporter substrate-binding protein [Desulfuromonadia bacterium]